MSNDVETGVAVATGIAVATGAAGERDFTEDTDESSGSNMVNACCCCCSGVSMGFLLFFAAFALLIWNEGRTIQRAKDLDEGQENVLELDLSDFSTTVSNSTTNDLSAFEKKLIHVTGPLSTTETLMDPTFGVGFDNMTEDSALKLLRSVVVYQWQENSTTTPSSKGRSGTTTYSYSQQWSSSLINSSAFNEFDQNRINPSLFPFEQLSLAADPILIGDRVELGPQVLDYVNWFEYLPVDYEISLSDVPDETLAQKLKLYGERGYYYGSGSDSSPQVGDARITFQYVPPDTVSIIALYYTGQHKNSLSFPITGLGDEEA
jgi:hypothetical protein